LGRSSKRSCLLLVLVLTCTVSCSADDLPAGIAGSARCSQPRTSLDSGAAAELQTEALAGPTWTMTFEEETFSSPRVADLNGDGVGDVVMGMGQDTFGDRQSSAVAIDGVSGGLLWQTSGFDDLIGTATLMHLNDDATLDVVLGGRRGALVAVDGSTGSTVWEFDNRGNRWFNFYTSQRVGDLDDDGIVDIVAANGGLRFSEPGEGPGLPDADDRHLGTIFAVSSADGSIIESIAVPDRGESYMSPLVLPAQGSDSGRDVLVGTGGETLPGSLWTIPLAALTEDRADFTQLLEAGDKGVVAAPSAGHFTDDCVLDVIVQSFAGTISLVDRAAHELLWQVTNPGQESYSSPTLGYFIGDDDIPDVFTSVATGVWPEYRSADYLLIDGASGDVVWRQTLGTFAPSGFVAADLNGDGRDEVIFGVNDEAANTLEVQMLDTAGLEVHELVAPLPQTTFSSLWLGDLDGDDQLELIVTESAYQLPGPARVHRFETKWSAPSVASWGAYLGTHGDGILPD